MRNHFLPINIFPVKLSCWKCIPRRRSMSVGIIGAVCWCSGSELLCRTLLRSISSCRSAVREVVLCQGWWLRDWFARSPTDFIAWRANWGRERQWQAEHLPYKDMLHTDSVQCTLKASAMMMLCNGTFRQSQTVWDQSLTLSFDTSNEVVANHDHTVNWFITIPHWVENGSCITILGKTFFVCSSAGSPNQAWYHTANGLLENLNRFHLLLW